MREKSSVAFPSVPMRPLSNTCFLTKLGSRKWLKPPLTSPQHKQWTLEERAGHHPSSFTKHVLISLWNQNLLCSMVQNIKTKDKSMSVSWMLAEVREEGWDALVSYIYPQGKSHLLQPLKHQVSYLLQIFSLLAGGSTNKKQPSRKIYKNNG